MFKNLSPICAWLLTTCCYNEHHIMKKPLKTRLDNHEIEIYWCNEILAKVHDILNINR